MRSRQGCEFSDPAAEFVFQPRIHRDKKGQKMAAVGRLPMWKLLMICHTGDHLPERPFAEARTRDFSTPMISGLLTLLIKNLHTHRLHFVDEDQEQCST